MKRWAAIALACLLVAGCGVNRFGEAFRPQSYVVRKGDTLYSIAWRYGIDHRALMRWNDIRDPRTLRPGVRLVLRPRGGGTASTTTASAPARSPTSEPPSAPAADGSASATGGGSADDGAAREPSGPGPAEWRWPAAGEIVGTFDDGAVAGRGIDIGGRAGQAVHAAAPGEVVYSGSGLKAYGRLLIIRHGGDYLSAYAHNRELLVAEGDRVEAGQRIARMGESRDGRPLLHFEIRRGGSPVDPRDYLPSR